MISLALLTRRTEKMEYLSKELNVVLEAVEEVGQQIMNIYNSDYQVELKADESPLTKADKLSHDLLISRLSTFPYGIISEESENIPGSMSNVYWVIDPLDGTSDFIQKTDEFSIMVALLKDGRPVLGVVYAPALDKLWYALDGKGAYMIENNAERRIYTSEIKDLKDYRFVISRNHFRQEDMDVANRLGITDFRKMGSVGVKFCRISQGLAELCVYKTSKMGLWDDCASHVILKEAGGHVFDVNGEEPSYNLCSRKMESGFIGTNGYNKKPIIEAVKSL